MVKRLGIVVGLAGVPVHAQLAVIDPANLAQAVLIAQRAQRHYEQLQAQYRSTLRMSQGLGNMEGYRTRFAVSDLGLTDGRFSPTL